MRFKVTVVFYVEADSELEAMMNLDRREIVSSRITVQPDAEGSTPQTYFCENVF